MAEPTKTYHAALLEALTDPREGVAYLAEALKESEELFLLALHNVAEVYGIAEAAEEERRRSHRVLRDTAGTVNPSNINKRLL